MLIEEPLAYEIYSLIIGSDGIAKKRIKGTFKITLG